MSTCSQEAVASSRFCVKPQGVSSSSYRKMIKKGHVGVLYSTAPGSGWYSSNKEYPGMLFDADLIDYVLDGDFEGALQLANFKYPEANLPDTTKLKVAWLPVGTVFDIEASEGVESLHVIGGINHLVA